MVGGARVFGPKPRDYWFKLNKKVKTLARKSALSYKAQANAIVIVEDFTFEAPKTKDFVAMVNNLKIADKKLLLVLPEANKNVYLSLVTEKMTAITEKLNRFGFIVRPEANKLEIKNEIEALYNVTVVDVNTLRYSGKSKSRYTKSGIINGRTNVYP